MHPRQNEAVADAISPSNAKSATKADPKVEFAGVMADIGRLAARMWTIRVTIAGAAVVLNKSLDRMIP